MRILFLDDDPERQKRLRRFATGFAVDFALSAAEAIRLLRKRAYDRMYLDHDLDDDASMRRSDDDESGQRVADWLAENSEGRHDCLFIVHSGDRRGASQLHATLKSAGLRVVVGEWNWKFDRPRV